MAGNRSLQKVRPRAPQTSSRALRSDPAAARITTAMSPAGFVINKHLDVVEFLGNTGPYIDFPVGPARLNLGRMLQPALRPAVLEAVRVVRSGSAANRKESLTLKNAKEARHLSVQVTRLDHHPSAEPAIRVLFEDAAPRPTAVPASRARPGKRLPDSLMGVARDARILRLKEELRMTRSALQSIIEEQEAGTARLKTSYHQLEDLNTELETTNEELALTNVELEALNRRLQVAFEERDAAQRERERMEAEIIHSQRLEGLRVMAGGVAHDFNNLLTSIVGNATLLLEVLPGMSASREMAEQIEKAGEHAAALVRQLLAFCGKGVFATQSLDLSSLVNESTDLLRASISKTAKLRFNLASTLPPIDADPTQVRQVLINLVVNASEAIGDRSGEIFVATGRRRLGAEDDPALLQNQLPLGDYVCLEVSDTGRGMSDEEKAKLFEPFFSTKFAGRGLGLAAVQGIVREHHGSIEVHSSLGQGSSMAILFPVVEGVSARSSEPVVEDQKWRGSGMVLVVDDEETVRNLAKAVLTRAGLQVVMASSGEEALETFSRQRRRIGLVLLDLVMPRMDGKQVLRGLRSMCSKTPVILSSGYSDQKPVAALPGGGAIRFLAKPYRPADLIAEVRQILEPASSKVREFPRARR